MLRFLLAVTVVLLSVYAVSCSKNEAGSKENSEAVSSIKPKEAVISLTAGFLSKNHTDEFNTVISPVSVMAAMAMAADGARGETLKEFETFLGGKKKDFDLYYKKLIKDYNSMDNVTLNVANRIFLNNFNPEKSYLTDLNSNFEANAQNLDFKAKESVDEINGWISEKTRGLIPQVLSSLDSSQLMILVNTLYFKSEWMFPFTSVYKDTFVKRNGDKITGDFMSVSGNLGYYKNENIEAVSISYKDPRFEMVLVSMQDSTQFNAGIFKEIHSNKEHKTLRLQMPKLNLEYGVQMEDYLRQYGPTSAFISNKADFKGISSDLPVYISGVLHKTKVIIDENGTEAAAVTVVMVRSAAMINYELIIFNKPFMFYIWDNELEIPVFAGFVEDIQ